MKKPNGQIANSLFQITSKPPQFALSLNKENLTCQYLQKSRKFSVSVLSKSAPLEFIGRFGFRSGRDIDKFKALSYKTEEEVPLVLEYAVAYFTAEVVRKISA